MAVKISDLNSNIYVRTALFLCLQYNLCAYNVVYVRSVFSKMYTKKLTFIPQFHIGALLQIHSIFSENLTLGDCLSIWSMMHILSYSFKKMFYIHKRRFLYFYIFWSLAAPCHLLRRLRLLNSWLGSDLPPCIKTPRLFGTL